MSFHENETDLKFALLVQLRPPASPLKMAEIEKDRQYLGKNSAIGLSKYVKSKALSPLPFPGKTQLSFAIFGLFLEFLQILTKFSEFVKTIWFHNFPVLQLYHKGHFRKNFTGFSSLAAFLGTTPTFLKKLVRYRFAPISNPKNEKAKSSYALV